MTASPSTTSFPTTTGTTNRTARITATAIRTIAHGIMESRAPRMIRRSSSYAWQKRNILATLLLSQGVPMLCGGDEFGRSQQGNNNAYCQDNELSWMSWERSPEAQALEDFTARLIALRQAHPIFRRPKYFTGRKARKHDFKDLVWLNPGGTEMHGDEWTNGFSRCLGAILSGDLRDVPDALGRPV